ncbi:hypothetical protein ABZ949_08460 [Micromonospora tulbaghiae]|uniref:hypothetical protein n=1 Tax=Micromonospora tulbaghiae TaxID=479978 RepID=UPI0033EB0C26
MNRLTLIGVTALEGAYAARLLHPDSHPQAVIPLLRLVWQYTLNGNTKALADTVLRHDWAWPHPAAGRPDRAGVTHPVADVSDTAPLDGIRRERLDAPVDERLERMYLVDVATESVQVYEATRRGRWLRHSTAPLDPDAAEPVLGCGGYTLHGHHWQPAHLWLPDARTGLAAEICLARHPHNAPVWRFTDATAQAICAATAPTEEQAARREPWLRRVGVEFDLVWPDRRGPHRLRRDADGLLLLDVAVPDWSWWLLPTPGKGENQ